MSSLRSSPTEGSGLLGRAPCLFLRGTGLIPAPPAALQQGLAGGVGSRAQITWEEVSFGAAGEMEGSGPGPSRRAVTVWPALAVGLGPDGAAGLALVCVACPWAWLQATPGPIHSRGKGEGAVGFAPWGAVVPVTSGGVFRIGVGASLLIFQLVPLTWFFSPCTPAWLPLMGRGRGGIMCYWSG